jgi:hypothetical protein
MIPGEDPPGISKPERYLDTGNKSLRLNPEFVEWSFKNEGYTLVNSYTSILDHLHFICPNGHNHKILWDAWNKGKRCSKCTRYRRLDREIVESKFNSRGFVLNTSETRFKWDDYIPYVCPKGHEHIILWRNFCRGVGCPYCTWGKNTEKCREIFKQLEKHGYEIIKPYNKSTIPIVYKTPQGDIKKGLWRHVEKKLQQIIKNYE